MAGLLCFRYGLVHVIHNSKCIYLYIVWADNKYVVSALIETLGGRTSKRNTMEMWKHLSVFILYEGGVCVHQGGILVFNLCYPRHSVKYFANNNGMQDTKFDWM